MAWIETIGPKQAQGELRELYDEAVRRSGRVFNVVRLSSLNSPVLSAWIEIYQRVMFGPSPLSRAEREMVAVVVSHENSCHY